MEDYLEDEEDIMSERENESCISSDLFYKCISDLELNKSPVIEENATVLIAIEEMKKLKVNCLAVIKSEKLVGILSEQDIVRKAFSKPDLKVKDIMTEDPVVLIRNDMVAYVFHNMQIGGFRHIPIVDEDYKPLHMVSAHDAISYILDFFPEEISNLPDEPFRGIKSREGA